MTQQLNEGLYEGDLKNTVDPLIIVDYYKPKFGEEKRVLVMTIITTDEGPADDLCRFIEKGSYDIIDVDTSPAPDTDGKYQVFIEIKRNRKMFGVLDKILTACNAVTGISKWKFIPYSYSDKLDWNKENFEKTIPQMPHLYGHNLSELERERIRKRIQFLNKY